MGTVNLIFNLLFSIFGVVFIVGTGLSTLFSKRKHLEKDLDYKKSFVACVLGILFIIGGITGHIYAVFLVIIMISTPFFWYAKKKYPEKYQYLSMGIWDNIFFVWLILWFIFIIVLCLVY
jgi:Na+-driven multidrug efflux pump